MVTSAMAQPLAKPRVVSTSRQTSACKRADRRSPSVRTTMIQSRADKDWYTFRHLFEVVSSSVRITMQLRRANNVVHSWIVNGSADAAGGNRYGWFPEYRFSFVAIDDSRRSQ